MDEAMPGHSSYVLRGLVTDSHAIPRRGESVSRLFSSALHP